MNQFADVTQEEFNKLVQAEVEKQLSSREEAEARQEAEEALQEAQTTFEALKASLEAKDGKIREYEEILANLDLDPSAAEVAANEKVVELENSIKELKHRAEVAEAALETLAREETAAVRMASLEEAGVSLENEAAEVQYSKVRNMTDEEFAAYKDELVALKSKYASTSEEDGEEDVETAELSENEIKMIAQSLGCDPSDAKCISLVREVAEKMSEVSKNRRAANKDTDKVTEAADADDSEENSDSEKAANKETASTKMSFGEAVMRSVDQNFQAPASLKEEMTQAWEHYYAEKRGETKSE